MLFRGLYIVAKSIYPALLHANDLVENGESSPSILRDCILRNLSDQIEVDYIVFISSESFLELDYVNHLDRVLFAGVISSCDIRLIDTLSF